MRYGALSKIFLCVETFLLTVLFQVSLKAVSQMEDGSKLRYCSFKFCSIYNTSSVYRVRYKRVLLPSTKL